MKRRGERCNLSHRPVGVIVLVDVRRRKYERYRGGGKEVLDADRGAFSAPACTLPRRNGFRGLEERHRVPGRVAGRVDAQRAQAAALQLRFDAGAVELATQER